MEKIRQAFAEAHNEVMHAIGVEEIVRQFQANMEDGFAVWKDTFFAFIDAVDWSEPFFKWLAVFHLLVLLCSVYATSGNVSDTRIFATLFVVIFLAACMLPLNYLGIQYNHLLFREKM
ncbi:hypothetical protein AGDE_08473 [Angomonas deanei]|uniref:Transmembrane protein 18, putative n=1 Tax=Angomonas deanei TaxID=59799 RepID=A0A7G2CAN3_9TRYP|nr:hypothetical protein AGDE_08473 [Angomonas deanei]CAD2215967.1 Transmembrane protein 18, putative [Angomonas deanei]|eukprot:EPY32863.1 hypothetical protein AGDE_08473 [Angomonas deanei]